MKYTVTFSTFFPKPCLIVKEIDVENIERYKDALQQSCTIPNLVLIKVEESI